MTHRPARLLLALAAGLGPTNAPAQTPTQPPLDSAALRHSITQLRDHIGRWNVVTEFLNEDGSVAQTVNGTYEFSWIVTDRVIAGRSDMPDLKRSSGILFYVAPRTRQIEMVSVGADGVLWVMSGALGGETRTTQEYPTAAGGTGRLRFTRYNITRDSFESRMEYSEDGGRSWKPGNRQVFKRAGGS